MYCILVYWDWWGAIAPNIKIGSCYYVRIAVSVVRALETMVKWIRDRQA